MTSRLHSTVSWQEASSGRFWQAVEKLGLDPDYAKIHETPEREMCCSLPVVMDNGQIEVFWGCRFQHSTQRGPAKGGIIFDPLVAKEEVRSVAAAITWKHSVANIPFGGAKGGIRCDAQGLSPGELERLLRRYTTRIMDIIGPDRDVPARDIDSTEQMMAWIYDTYSMHTRQWHIGVVTGKPVAMGGSYGAREATGYGVYVGTREACKTVGIDLAGSRIIVHGFRNIGPTFSRFVSEHGASVVAVAHGNSAILNEGGLDAEALSGHFSESGGFEGFGGGETIPIHEFYSLECDIFASCAADTILTPEVAGKIRAKIFVEGDDCPATQEADQALDDKGVFVVPDLLGNAGVVTGSYLEWVQNRQGIFFSREEVLDGIDKQMVSAFATVNEYKKRFDTDMRNAAYILAVDRVVTAARMRGIYA